LKEKVSPRFRGDRKRNIKHKIPRSYSAAEENAASFMDLGMTNLERLWALQLSLVRF
jgi:hypothetical protein